MSSHSPSSCFRTEPVAERETRYHLVKEKSNEPNSILHNPYFHLKTCRNLPAIASMASSSSSIRSSRQAT